MSLLILEFKKKKVFKIVISLFIISVVIFNLFYMPIYNKVKFKYYNILQFVPGITTNLEAIKYREKLLVEGDRNRYLLVRRMADKTNQLHLNGDKPILYAPVIGNVVLKTSIRGKGMTLEEIYDTLENNDSYIDFVCKEYNIPKEVLVAVLFREMYCIDFVDNLQNYSKDIVSNKSTLGIAQISIKMARKSEEEILENKRSEKDIYNSLITEKGSIYNCALLIRYYGNQNNIDKITKKESKIIFKSYNSGKTYADSLYEYMIIFEKFYRSGGFNK